MKTDFSERVYKSYYVKGYQMGYQRISVALFAIELTFQMITGSNTIKINDATYITQTSNTLKEIRREYPTPVP